jgi:dihydropteroate synthase
MHWQTARFRIDLTSPKVMGIVNVTPDSFSDGGLYAGTDAALAHCEKLIAEGADILDIGGESSRPGATLLPADEELRRILPVLRQAVKLGVPVSVDTCKPEVMRMALREGVDIINDIHALTAPGALECVAGHPQAGACLMHMQGLPASMQDRPQYTDVVGEVLGFLGARCEKLAEQGIAPERIVVDPGIGFGKSVAHNVELLARQAELLAVGRPLLVGWSRKSTLGMLTGRPVEDRLAASVAAALAAVERGAHIVRVHDVAATVDALRVWRAAGLGPAAWHNARFNDTGAS